MTYDMAGDGDGGKRLLGRLGAGAAAFGALAVLGSKPAAAASAAAYSDADILNFALNLEYLEAEYYTRAVFGVGLSTFNTSAKGTVTAPATTKVPFLIPAYAGWAADIANDEIAHVRFLQTALGSAAVPEPAIDLMTSFNTLAIAAGLIPSGSPVGTFNPFADEISFLLGAYIFEDVGVTAYAGAAGALTSAANVSYGASILAVEAMHAGLIRSVLSEIGAGAATDAISALRFKLSGIADNGTDTTGMTVNNGPGNAYNFVNTDYNGQVYRRTPQQVLNVVFGAPGTGVTSGLFFPAGVNGTITST